MKEIIFTNFKFSTPDLDDFFKKSFLFNFYYHEIKFQTIELFKLKLLSHMTLHKVYIETIYKHNEDIISGTYISSGSENGESSTDSETINNNRFAHATTPQNTVNINLEDEDLKYADSNEVAKNKNNGNVRSTNKNNRNDTRKQFNVGDIYLCKDIYKRIFDDLESELFMWIF